MKRIVIACDGTWNRLDAAHPTNVAKLAQAVLPEGADGGGADRLPRRRRRHRARHRGAGAGGGPAHGRALRRGADGEHRRGLPRSWSSPMRRATKSTSSASRAGPLRRGRSRGSCATAAFSSGAMPRRFPRRSRSTGRGRRRAGRMRRRRWRSARARRACGDKSGGSGLASGRGGPTRWRCGCAYLGVWDTVGALGMPAHLWLAARLNRGLRLPRHGALARRGGGAPRGGDRRAAAVVSADALGQPRRRWSPRARSRPIAQRWFPGDHASIGGGGAVTALSDDALLWVAEGAAAAGLGLDPAALAAWRAGRDWRGPIRARGDAPPSLLGRTLALDSADRVGPGRVADLRARGGSAVAEGGGLSARSPGAGGARARKRRAGRFWSPDPAGRAPA